MKRKKSINAQDVADAAGVSRSTVSRAFTPGASVAPEIRKRVVEVAERIGYRAEPLARILVRQKNKLVAVIMSDLINPIRSSMMDVLVGQLQSKGMLALIFKCDNASKLAMLVDHIIKYKVSVLVVTGFSIPNSAITRCVREGVPILMLNRGRSKGVPASVVSCDHSQGGYLAAKALVESGCERIAMVSGTPKTGANEERIQGFLEGLEEMGKHLWMAEDGVFSYDSGCLAATRLFSSGTPPDGVFCLNDEIALGLMDTARVQFGLSIPKDLSVIGYDDIPISGWPTYKLSTIKQPTDQLIKECVDAILTLRDFPNEQQNVIIPVKLIARSTLRT